MDIRRQKIGKKNRASGQRFERKVRKDLEEKGWIVSRWMNNVKTKSKQGVEYAYESYKLIPAKRGKFGLTTTGFPDFITYRPEMHKDNLCLNRNEGVEIKSNGYLDKEEKEKCKWLTENFIFSKILIAKKGKKRGTIEYDNFERIEEKGKRTRKKGRKIKKS